MKYQLVIFARECIYLIDSPREGVCSILLSNLYKILSSSQWTWRMDRLWSCMLGVCAVWSSGFCARFARNPSEISWAKKERPAAVLNSELLTVVCFFDICRDIWRPMRISFDEWRAGMMCCRRHAISYHSHRTVTTHIYNLYNR